MKFLNKIDGANKLVTDANSRLVTDTKIAEWDSKAEGSHKHSKNDINDFPTSLPASGGDASTVNGFTILKSVPANANFSNTIYSVISTSEIDAGVSTLSRAISGARVKYMLDKTKPVISKVKPTNGSPIWYEEL